MKKFAFCLLTIILILCVSSCGKGFSKSKYEEVSKYVNENKGNVEAYTDIEYYNYEVVTKGFENITYGYYYTKNDEIHSCQQGQMSLPTEYTEIDDGGYYFGEVSENSDWSFIRKITDNWYYFEVHDYLY